jgi:hypothetical protein
MVGRRLRFGESRKLSIWSKAYDADRWGSKFGAYSHQASPTSRARIDAALAETAAYVKAKPWAPWSTAFYQLANRIAHLYFLRKHGLQAWLLLVNFVGDRAMEGPSSDAEWKAAYQVAWHVLGVPKQHRLASYIVHVFPSVSP